MDHARRRALGVAALFFAGFWALRASVDRLQALFSAGNVLGSNSQSELSALDVDALLGQGQLLLLAVSVTAFVRWASGAEGAPASKSSWGKLMPFASVAAVALGFGIHAAVARSTVVFGERHFYLRDDAMTSMIYARNLVEGAGLVYAPGERVEGYSNFLWTLVMALIHVFGAGPAQAPLWVMLLGWSCVAVTACLTLDLLRARGLGWNWAVCCALAVSFDQNVMTWAYSGFETSALTAAVSACAWSLARNQPRMFAMALASIPLWRSDGFLIAAALALAAGVLGGFSRAWWRSIAPALAVTLLHFGFRWAYYGYLLPNTYYLKMIDWPDRLQVGFGGYGFRLVLRYPLLLALAGAALARGRPVLEKALALVVFSQCAYAICVGGDIFRYLRFVTPVLPLLYVCAVLSLRRWVEPQSEGASRFARACLLGVCPVLSSLGRLGLPPDESGFFRSSLSLARLLDANTPAGTLASIYPAGTIPYYAHRQRFVDVFGKNDEHLAHREQYEGLAIGHNKFDFDYVYDQRRPAVAIVQSPCASIEQYVAASDEERSRMRDLLGKDDAVARFYDMAHPTFLREYRDQRVVYVDTPTPTPMECVFVRAGASISHVWSMSGSPERSSRIRLDASGQGSRGNAWFGTGWKTSTAGSGRTVRAFDGKRSAIVDVLVDTGEPLSLVLCLSLAGADPGTGALTSSVNAAALPLAIAADSACEGLGLRAEISREVLGRRPQDTRIELRALAGSSVFFHWLELSPRRLAQEGRIP